MERFEIKRILGEIENARWRTSGEDVQFAFKDGLLLFQGSASLSDWVHNFDAPAIPYKDMAEEWRAHRGFVRLYKSVRDVILNVVAGEESLRIAGFSQGGALSLLAYEDIRFFFPAMSVDVCAIGAPRVFWKPTNGLIARAGTALLVHKRGDPVPMVPPRILGYRHVGQVMKIGQPSILNPFAHKRLRYMADLQGG